jgi:hypothetical protein
MLILSAWSRTALKIFLYSSFQATGFYYADNLLLNFLLLLVVKFGIENGSC